MPDNLALVLRDERQAEHAQVAQDANQHLLVAGREGHGRKGPPGEIKDGGRI